MRIHRIFSVLSTLLLVACSGGVANPDLAQRSVSWDRQAGWQEADDRDRSFSFVVIGCNRIDSADLTPENPSTANIEQLNRTFREVAELRPLPKFFFFVGDLVYGYDSDASVIEGELAAWRKLYESSSLPELGVELVAIPGNHETQGTDRLAYLAAEEAWLRVMEPYIARGGNGPHEGGEDELTTDQSRLTYSFNYRGTHFLILDTDPVDWDWRVPVRWIQHDLEEASKGETQHIFALGHKPAFPWPGVETDGLSRYPKVRDDFWASMEKNGADAMFSAHNHLWYKQRPNPDGTWQVIAGNGGSKLESTFPPEEGYFGFTLVTVSRQGDVTVTSFGRDVPKEGYLAPSDQYPTSIRDSFSLN